MEVLQTLAVALGLATLAGLNLYLTVFAAGLAINQHWIILAPQYHQLEVLGQPVVIIIAGIVYFVEFFADKIPWVDSLWDTIHTVIRPIGGALLAVRALGSPSPVFDVVVALLAGSATLIAHGAKAGTRLVANGSPEPFSNIALSVTEDVAVLGGLALIHWNPVVALLVFTSFLGTIVYFAPKLFRGTSVIAWLAWKKLSAPAGQGDAAAALPTELAPDHDVIFSRYNVPGETIAWTVPCLSGGGGLPANYFGALIATEEAPRQLYFVAKRRLGKVAVTLDLEGYKVACESKFLSENIVLYGVGKKPRYVLQFDRPRAHVAATVCAKIRERLAQSPSDSSLRSDELEPALR